ncbi:hypothetical protein VOI54_14420 [Tamlana sp. 2201CG12-4]|uniref:hypothetical protein n=1 Tax=Tamlana sp. 2201CG12-4 TaxID=3112582 RepID=UPI002DBF4BD2|nr:hypothetical protein [Tamlana sp. 2201CG12-4]MEC3908221.1 hypothetical protein [Tamlana sp. 2201CG12-4]
MKFSRVFLYAYLIFAIYFAYVAITKYTEAGTIDYPSILLSATAIFVFFFRRNFIKKFDKRNNSK